MTSSSPPTSCPNLGAALARVWFHSRLAPGLWPLVPLSGLFVAASVLRRLAYKQGWKSIAQLPVPTVVVGNLVVGGAGKTPLTQALVGALLARGRRPGIVSRGYGGRYGDTPRPVSLHDDSAVVGDEPLLLATTGVPVWVGRDRAAAAHALLAAHPDTDLILCDDGLQHLKLGRDFEIAVFDRRGPGNGWRLPAGPLRDPLSRLCHLAGGGAVVVNGGQMGLVGQLGALPKDVPVFDMALVPDDFAALDDASRRMPAAQLQAHLAASSPRVVAMAGIGDPSRFFSTLSGLGLQFEARAFPDHHAYGLDDFAGLENAVVLMTAKDGVKCRSLPLVGRVKEAWVLPVTAKLSPDLAAYVLEKIDGCSPARYPGMPGVQGQSGVPQDYAGIGL